MKLPHVWLVVKCFLAVLFSIPDIEFNCPFSYYPLYPPAEEANMDYDKFQQFGQMNLTPDILIVPSELRYFIKVNNLFFRYVDTVSNKRLFQFWLEN